MREMNMFTAYNKPGIWLRHFVPPPKFAPLRSAPQASDTRKTLYEIEEVLL